MRLAKATLIWAALATAICVPIAFAAASPLLAWSVGSVSAQTSGTAAEARAMLDNAAVALKANEATALAAFNDKSNTKFRDRDLYVFCYDMALPGVPIITCTRPAIRSAVAGASPLYGIWCMSSFSASASCAVASTLVPFPVA